MDMRPDFVALNVYLQVYSLLEKQPTFEQSHDLLLPSDIIDLQIILRRDFLASQQFL